MKGCGKVKRIINEMKLRLPARSENESVCRAVISAFTAELNPTVEELGDIRCAVSEAVTNCIVHAYRHRDGIIYINVSLLEGRIAKIEIKDKGCGIDDVKEARQPLFTTDAASERSGMGFTVMESFTDKLRVTSKVGRGTSIVMFKVFGDREDI